MGLRRRVSLWTVSKRGIAKKMDDGCLPVGMRMKSISECV